MTDCSIAVEDADAVAVADADESADASRGQYSSSGGLGTTVNL